MNVNILLRELTPFEQLVCEHLCDGLTNSAIARETAHTEKVIENTVSRVAQSFAIKSNGEVNLRAARKEGSWVNRATLGLLGRESKTVQAKDHVATEVEQPSLTNRLSFGLLDKSENKITLQSVGMEGQTLSKLKHLIAQPHGIILVTGPTGSGKTTTLYGLLSELNQAGSKIITVEDPVEYRLPRINQVQVNHKIGLSFSNVLRTTLRQDPDIIMVGEMRDQETAEMGLRGALTGHLVLSTLHTNDAVTVTVNDRIC